MTDPQPFKREFLRQRWSITEAAWLLEIPVATLRTQLKRGWLPIYKDPDAERWGPFNAEDLLRIRVTQVFSDNGIAFADARRRVLAAELSWFGDETFLYIVRNREGDIIEAGKSTVPEVGVILGNSQGNSFAGVILNDERKWLRERIDGFYSEERKT